MQIGTTHFPRKNLAALALCATGLLVNLALPGPALAATYSTIWSDGFNGNLDNWVQSTAFTYSTAVNHGGYTGAGAALCAAGASSQMYRAFPRPFAQAHASGYFYDNKGGWKVGFCGSAFRQVLSLRNSSSLIMDNGISGNGDVVYKWRTVGAGGTGASTSYANRWTATPCNPAWIFYEITVTPGATTASWTAKVTDGGGATTGPAQTLSSTFFTLGIERVTLGLGTSSTVLNYWDDILFEAYTPGAPTIGTATANSSSQITWTWTTADNNMFGFDVADSGGTMKSPQYPTAGYPSHTAASWVETGLAANTAYTREVRAWNGSLNSDYSSTVTKTTLGATPTSSSVTSDKAFSCPGTAVIWTAVGGFGAGKIQYYRYVWDQNAIYASWADTETQWSSGTLSTTPTSTGNWYLHLKGYNADNVGNGTYDYAIAVGFQVAATVSENIGTPAGTTPIASYTGWQNNGVLTFTGTAEVRITSASSGYAGASGGGNVFISNVAGTEYFQIAGINSVGQANLQLSFGIFKSTTASSASDFVVEVSSDGTTYTPLSFTALPTGAGTAIWYLRTASGTIPATPNLRIRFRQTATACQYRVDDIKLTGTSTSAAVAANGPTTLCAGSSVGLVASVGSSWSWSPAGGLSSTTVQNPTASPATTTAYTVTVTDVNGCTSQASQTVTVNAVPSAPTAANDGPICAGSTLHLTASTVSGATYAWTGPNGFTSSDQNPTIASATTAATGQYSVTATVNGCTSAPGTTSVMVNAVPLVTSGPTPSSQDACLGFPFSISVSASGGSLNYQWRKRDTSLGWGTGNGWQFSYNSTSCDQYNGVYIGSATACSQSPGINNNGKAFGLYANNWNSVEAKRNFGNLQVAQTVSFDLQIPVNLDGSDGSGNNSQALFALRNSGNEGSPRFEIWVKAGDSFVTISDGTGDESATVPYDSNGYHCVFKLTSTDTYDLTVTKLDDSSVYTFSGRSLKGTSGNAISQVRAWLRNYDGTQGSACRDFFINNVVAGAYEDNANNYTAGSCGSTTWTTSANLGFGPISGATGSTYSINPVSAGDAGSYDVVVWNTCGQAISSAATLTVNPTSAGGAAAAAASPVCNASAPTINLSGQTGNVTKWQYSSDNFASDVHDIANATTTLDNAPTITATTYYRAVVTSGVCSSADSSVATVTISPATSDITGSSAVAINQLGKTYSVTPTTGSSYAWTVPSGASITAGATGPNNNQITVNFGGAVVGNVAVTETTSGSCVGSPKSLAVTVGPNHAPVAQDLSMGVTVGASGTLTIIGGKHPPTDADGNALTVSAVQNPSAKGRTVTTDGTSVTYTPVSSADSGDTFTYTVSDGQGGTDTKTVTVTVTDPGAGTGQNLAAQDRGDGIPRIIIGGTPGVCYQLQYASSVPTTSWTDLGSIIHMPSGGIYVYDDTGFVSPRFYRTVVVSCPP
jgi:Bacterial Ig domain